MYYPLSQITPNLYTNGGEYVTRESNQPYSGYYWKSSDGKYFTGKTPQDTPTKELISLKETSDNKTSIDTTSNVISYYDKTHAETITYLNLKKPPFPPSPPSYFLNIPTQQDYQVGEFRRYFCKKANEIIYLEISKITYDKLVNKNPTILYQLYQPFNIPWQLTGDETQAYITNRNIVELTMKQQKLPQFDKYLKKDYTKYGKFTITTFLKKKPNEITSGITQIVPYVASTPTPLTAYYVTPGYVVPGYVTGN